MKVFYGGSYKGSKELGLYIRKIYDCIEKAGYKHLDSEIINVTYEDFVKRMESSRDANLHYYEQRMASLSEADICVFEVSYHSLGIGFLLEKALKDNKPTIALYYKDYVPYFLSGVVDDKLILKRYNEKNVNKVVLDALEQARIHREKRFNFFISPRLLVYLDKEAKKQGVTKSLFIRNLIIEHMQKNKEEIVE